MKVIHFISTGLMFALLAFSSCYYDNVETLYPDGSNCDVSSVDFQSTIQPLIDAKCATSGCHVSGTGRKDLSTVQGIVDIANDGRLEDRTLIIKDMPPSQPLSICERAAIREWLDKGAPVN